MTTPTPKSGELRQNIRDAIGIPDPEYVQSISITEHKLPAERFEEVVDKVAALVQEARIDELSRDILLLNSGLDLLTIKNQLIHRREELAALQQPKSAQQSKDKEQP